MTLAEPFLSDAPRRIVLAHEAAFRLGGQEVRPGSREVVGPRGREVLEPKVMQVLVALARAEGRILTRDELIEACWEGRQVGDDAITRVISRLRRLSESRGHSGWTLETITKVGYRLLADGVAPDPASMPARDAPARPHRRLLLATGAAGVATLAGGGAFLRLRRPPVSDRARGLYERGREAVGQGQLTENAQAIGFLKAAVEDSPGYAAAWGALALAYQGGIVFVEPARQAGVAGQAQAAAKRALALEPANPDASVALALLPRTYRNWETAERELLTALAMHPGEPRVEITYSRLLLGVGRVAASVDAAQIAVRGDVFAPWYPFALGGSLWAAGRNEEAEAVLRKALTLWPRQHAVWFQLFDLLACTGRADEALALLGDQDGRPVAIPIGEFERLEIAGKAMRTGARPDIDAAVAGQLAVAPHGVGYAENAMNWLSVMGRLDDAFTVARALYLDEGYTLPAVRFSMDQGRRYMQAGNRYTHLLFMPQTAAMRRDPRFGRLMRDTGLTRYWAASGRRPDDPAWATV